MRKTVSMYSIHVNINIYYHYDEFLNYSKLVRATVTPKRYVCF